MTALAPALQARVDHTLVLLRQIAQKHSPAVFANSFGAEDMVLTDLIARENIGIEIFSLDTGRLPAETYELMQKTAETYPAVPIRVYFPRAESVEKYVNEQGINAFYQSVE
ncbi:MAG: phosphoadenosine phosphosulfate reductase family protein, partial [Burkholderiales bacterium]|nr:phosphoadenosine phosphosulfate reductase family protein [Burkholderiales bacterium]